MTALIATLRDGTTHRLNYPDIETMITDLTEEAFTGSGVPLEGLEITADDGTVFLYSDAATFAEEIDYIEEP